jgi:3-oxoadipate enol-lactonase
MMRVRGVEIESEVAGTGSGPALLWGHALMGSMRQEDEAGIMPWAGLSEEARLVRWDARGHGASEATLVDEDYCWSELAADLWALADALGEDEVVLGGISMGVGTALHAAMLAPERTLGLVLMAPPTAWESRPRQSQLYRTTARMLDFIGLGPFRCIGQTLSYAARNKSLGKLQRSVMRGLRSADPRVVHAALRGAALSDLPEPDRLEKLDVPTLILAWTGDWSHPLSTAEELAARLPNASLVVAKDANEIEEWPHVLGAFLDDLGSGADDAAPRSSTGLPV